MTNYHGEFRDDLACSFYPQKDMGENLSFIEGVFRAQQTAFKNGWDQAMRFMQEPIPGISMIDSTRKSNIDDKGE